MKEDIKNSIPERVLDLAQTLQSEGFEAYLVGGCVRDMLMGRDPNDWDITTNARPEEIVALFEKKEHKVVYENTFGTVAIVFEDEPLDSSIRSVEITPYRLEESYSDHRHPDAVTFSTNIEDDLKRRDFTINAIAYDPFGSKGHGVLKDMYKGQTDIKDMSVRAVGDPNERFSEDALRMLRAVRFVSQLGFSVSHETMDALVKNAPLLKHVSKERIRDEFVKIIVSREPSVGIGLLVKLGLMEHIIPELLEGVGCEQKGAHMYDVFEHLVQALQHAADKEYSFHIRLAALFHDIGKPRTRRVAQKSTKGPGVQYTFYGHEVVGARMARDIMRRLKFSKKDIDIVSTFVRWHMFFSDPEKITLSAVRRLVARVGEDMIWELMKIRECDRVGMKKKEAPYRLRKYFAMIEQVLRDPISVKQLKINGDYMISEMKMKPGPRMGWILHALLEEVLEDPERNTLEYLEKKARDLDELSDKELKERADQAKEKSGEEEEKEIEKLHVKHKVKK